MIRRLPSVIGRSAAAKAGASAICQPRRPQSGEGPSSSNELATAAPTPKVRKGLENYNTEDYILPKSRRPMNEAAQEQLRSHLIEEEQRQMRRAAQQEALQQAGGSADGGGGPSPAEVDEPTLEDLDISIPMVDCAFVAELVQRRLEVRDTMHLRHKEREADAAADAQANPFRAGVSDSDVTNPAGTAVTPVATAVAGDSAGGEAKQEEPEPETWRDEYEDGFVFIDLRTVGEVSSWGIIEGAKILPAHEFWEAMTEGEESVFYDRWGFHKPDKQADTLLLYCQYGPRSLMAAQIAVYLGYKKVVVLRDGYYEWAKQFNKLCRRFRLHDIETQNDANRSQEFLLARAIGRDIAPEFNDVVAEEVEQLKIDTSRSRGSRIVDLPEEAEKIMLEVRERQQQELAMLEDPVARQEFIRQQQQQLADASPDGVTGGASAERITHVDTEMSAMDKFRRDAEKANQSFAQSAADVLGVPAAKTPTERREETIGARLLLARKRRQRRPNAAAKRVEDDEIAQRKERKIPHRAVWRTF